MPQGYKTISIKEKIHGKIKAIAEKTGRTIPGLITYLFETYPGKLEKLAKVGETGKELSIPPELYESLEERVKAKGLGVEEYVAHLLRSASKELS